MADNEKKFFLFDTNDDNQLGPFVIAVIVTLVIFVLGIASASFHH